MNKKIYGVWVRSHSYEEWTHYGDCTAQELRNERRNLRDFYVRVVNL